MNHLNKDLNFFQISKLNSIKLDKLKKKNKRKSLNNYMLHNQNSLCWSFYCINDNAKVDNKDP